MTSDSGSIRYRRTEAREARAGWHCDSCVGLAEFVTVTVWDDGERTERSTCPGHAHGTGRDIG